ncbi:hypothetical protein P692DRAFT_20821981 [Suillus brevipes Sb2]|nr:hypothetical protein P692DRAFT_20821981 [Suillus brevipes Sb2]
MSKYWKSLLPTEISSHANVTSISQSLYDENWVKLSDAESSEMDSQFQTDEVKTSKAIPGPIKYHAGAKGLHFKFLTKRYNISHTIVSKLAWRECKNCLENTANLQFRNSWSLTKLTAFLISHCRKLTEKPQIFIAAAETFDNLNFAKNCKSKTTDIPKDVKVWDDDQFHIESNPMHKRELFKIF